MTNSKTPAAKPIPTHTEAHAAFDKARAAYRAGELGDDEYLAAREAWEADQSAFDSERGELAPRYTDAQKLHWYACQEDSRLGSIADGDARCIVTDTDRGTTFERPLEEC